jgi:hypothetical protein
MTMSAAEEAINNAKYSPNDFKNNKKLKYRTVNHLNILTHRVFM